MENGDILVVCGAFLFAGLVKGTTGLGFATTALSFLVYAIGLKEALPLLIVPSVVSNLIVMRDAGHFRATLIQFRLMYAAAPVGIFIGLALLMWLDPTISSAILGLVLIIYGVITITQPAFRLPTALARRLEIPVGFTTGLVNGVTGSQVMPVLPYLLSLPLERNVFIQAINISFTISSVVFAIGLAWLGLFTVDTTQISFVGLVAMLVGLKLGIPIRRRLPQSSFRRAVLGLLVLLGAGLVLRSLL
ncbi:MAG TPA: sulfite exporter TauE/SafE family protein [Gammaproteobacteria bacterium]|nr:MAG: hypothetical protein COA89_06595 [Acidithiobacillus sp.]RTZ65028.1 MAG: sulfite exporter TauE/SafE family protein [Gammaproteobacteria bacterium]HAD37708.1 hypothetical protein [Gammaproteobacteria bacterium]HBK77515.1 hypothetical protein [Gammaproteobacteria bacterium]HHZ71905.1 sulfite exporter TauE/SafE family protein [Gammaproteobacteria bacterium]